MIFLVVILVMLLENSYVISLEDNMVDTSELVEDEVEIHLSHSSKNDG